jgi:hypothetical protein
MPPIRQKPRLPPRPTPFKF